jgi:phosphoglucosamine mutase
MFESALEAGFVAAGVNVMLIGPLPTPGIAYLTSRVTMCTGPKPCALEPFAS